MLCQYRNIFGEPDKGLHKYRICGYAAVDIFLTLLGSYLLWKYYFKTGYKDLILITLGMFLLGILLHRLFCVNTTLNVQIFGEIKE